jgi:hypothetical protein
VPGVIGCQYYTASGRLDDARTLYATAAEVARALEK